MHFISENTHRGLLWNSDDLHNINTHLLCERSVTWSLSSLSGCFSIPGGKTIRRLKRRLETIFSSRGACILNLQGWAFPGLFLFVQFIKETGLRGSMWDGRMFNTTWMNEVGQWWLRPPAPLQYQFRIKFLIKEAHRQIEEFQEYPDVARKQEQTCRPISCLKGLQEPSQSCQSYPKASSLIWWHFWHMWLQLSPELPKDILRAKHPCKRPPTSKLPMKSYTSQQWRGMDLLRCDWGPMPSSFRTQFLKDTPAMQPAPLLYLPEHKPPFTEGSCSRKRQEDCCAGSGCLGCFWGCFQQWSIPIASLLRQKSSGLRDFTSRHHITQPICVYGRLPKCISAIPNLHTVELHVCIQLPALKPLSKGAQ